MKKTKFKLGLSVLPLVAALTGCVTAAQNEVRHARMKPILASETTFRQFIGNTTTHSFHYQHGTQIEYVTADGRTFLAYPGNSIVLPGKWKVIPEKSNAEMQMCFQYGENTYNPVTNVVGSEWECGEASSYLVNLDEIYNGDLFGMARAHNLPKKLSKDSNTSVAEAMNSISKGPLKAFNKAPFRKP